MSPILSNLYLDRLDQFVEKVLLPAYNRGARRKSYPPYMALLNAARNKRIAGDREEAKTLRRQAQQMPSRDPNDPEFRRLWYVRYADDGAPRRRGKEAEMVTELQPCGTRDGGRPSGAGWQEQAPSHLQRQWSRAPVVSVQEKADQESGRSGPSRRTPVNR
ncbi:MAG TPA: hypothetical protein VKJ47_24790 [Candidatus Binatia bacterium]|nr:hypothetical protein [Candidatus Binatia bacterium]